MKGETPVTIPNTAVKSFQPDNSFWFQKRK
ncbi:hypothetical protein M8044_000250 [Columbia Basin potato purple top phytoplasma]|uniref:Uncharacterized protein n=1 Tax=Columbia Basin potato purple top phytoplasma TaxID=307134 RepID=A0ABT5L9S8_9MOLU|nr:hypothetical protein [Columbia Basin potato purple top phytoplasma]